MANSRKWSRNQKIAIVGIAVTVLGVAGMWLRPSGTAIQAGASSVVQTILPSSAQDQRPKAGITMQNIYGGSAKNFQSDSGIAVNNASNFKMEDFRSK